MASAMRLFANITLLIWLTFGLGCLIARADGGRLALVERQGDFQISVFTSHKPVRAGPVDLSVLLQDAKTQQPVSDASVSVSLTHLNETTRRIHASATSSA